MKKEFIIILAASIGLVVFLAMQPKVVVNNAKEKLQVNTSTANRDKKPAEQSASHSKGLSPEQQKKVDALKQKLETATAAQKVGVIENLMLAFSEGNRIDSAAKYAEGLLAFNDSEVTLLKIADTYYQAYGYALSDEKGNVLGEKAREFYKKALDRKSVV